MFVGSLSAQTCSFTISSYKGCVPHPVSFKPSVTGSVKQYLWFFGDGDSSSQNNPSHVYNKPGTYHPLLIIFFSDGTTCKAQPPQPVEIFENPTADMNVTDGQQVVLCHRGQPFCFQDKSKPGSSKAPMKQWVWSLGDGSLTTQQNPCYSYADSGTYTIILEATDSNGCKDIAKRTIHLTYADIIADPLKPFFKVETDYDCHKNQIIMKFDNLTDTTGQGVSKFRWDFGDGVFEDCTLKDTSCLKNWLSQTHRYTKSGQYFPSLTVTNKYGCTETYSFDTGVYLPDYHFTVDILPSTDMCISILSELVFRTPYHPYASYYRWNFGDPLDSGYGRAPEVIHKYGLPGTYTVTLEVKIGDCILDTVLCKKIHIYETEALIMPKNYTYKNPDHTDWIKEKPIAVSDYPDYFNINCNGPPEVSYFTHDTLRTINGDTTYSYCNADTAKIVIDSTWDCSLLKKIPVRHYILKPKVVSVKDLIVPVAYHYYWHTGDNYPAYPVFRDSVAIDSAIVMNDTQFVAPTCSAPHKVTFTNFSIKNRGYFAVDNDPLALRDTCLNPFYPHPSDSLTYTWNFREGTPALSTPQSPDVLASLSEEVTPTHLFTHSGCYWVLLEVRDTITGCSDIDSVPVVMQGADAGWDSRYHVNRMTWFMQDTIKNNSLREGLILAGPPCVNTDQYIDLSQTLPSCYKPQLAMILDSSKQAIPCDSGQVRFIWLSKNKIESLNYKVRYQDTGWKTLALVIRNNANCYDTVWYSNYKYFFRLFPQLSAEKRQVCAGEPIILHTVFPDQPGIRVHYSHFSLVGINNDTFLRLKPDTFRFRVLTTNGIKDTATSTVHNKNWGLDDGSLNFNYLYDTMTKVVNQPGHLVIKSWIRSRFGCIDSSIMQVMVGHFVSMDASNRVVCTGDTVHFYDDIRYFQPVHDGNAGIDSIKYWDDPVKSRNGRKPLHEEKLAWDFDGDGIADDSSSNPSHVYTKSGTYTVNLITTDSTGCKQITKQPNYITVIAPVAKFGVDSPGDVRYCAPAFFRFIDSSYVTVPGDTSSKVQLYSWTWDYGDSTAPVTVYDPSKSSHFYTKNGTYKVKLTVSTSPATGQINTGCQATFTKTIRILGPTADFIPITPVEGCVPLTVKFLNKSKKAAVQEWKQGDGINFSSTDDTITMTYKRPGTYCPMVEVADTIVDILGNKLYCKDSAPNPLCLYKVIVHKNNVIRIAASDTLLCAGQTVGVFAPVPDTGYTSWTLNYGNGIQQTQAKPPFKYTYPNTGHYTLTLSGTGAYCPQTAKLNVRVIDIKSIFGVDSTQRDTPTFTFKNYSLNSVRYKWDFGDGTPPVETNSKDPISHEFQKSGRVQICLTAYNEKDCPDESCLDIDITTGVWIPNIFTPDGDAYDPTFHINIWGQTNYYLEIYNRWGQRVFHSDNRDHQWDGNDERSGLACVPATYFYVFKYKLIGEKDKTVQGTVDLVR
jgi:gliding motility-associated-like protein